MRSSVCAILAIMDAICPDSAVRIVWFSDSRNPIRCSSARTDAGLGALAFAPAFAPAVVDNEANLFHVYVRSGVDPPLEGMVATFDLSAAPITVSMAPLPGGTGALAVRAAQWQ